MHMFSCRATFLCLSLSASLGLTGCNMNKLAEAVKVAQTEAAKSEQEAKLRKDAEAKAKEKASYGKGSDNSSGDDAKGEEPGDGGKGNDPTQNEGDDPTQNEGEGDVIVIGSPEEGGEGESGKGEEGDGDVVVEEEPEVPGDVTGGEVVTQTPTGKEQQMINSCAKALGMDLPLSNGKVRIVTAGIGILGSSTLRDSRETVEPELTLIVASVNILGGMRWQLMNPNGLYCVVSNVNVLSNMTIEISKSAKLADGVLGINILSANQSSTSGVNVLSKVKVVQK